MGHTGRLLERDRVDGQRAAGGVGLVDELALEAPGEVGVDVPTPGKDRQRLEVDLVLVLLGALPPPGLVGLLLLLVGLPEP